MRNLLHLISMIKIVLHLKNKSIDIIWFFIQISHMTPQHDRPCRASYTLKGFLCQNLKAFAIKAVAHYPQACRRLNHSMVASKVFMKSTQCPP